jgi:hypothetical protein
LCEAGVGERIEPKKGGNEKVEFGHFSFATPYRIDNMSFVRQLMSKAATVTRGGPRVELQNNTAHGFNNIQSVRAAQGIIDPVSGGSKGAGFTYTAAALRNAAPAVYDFGNIYSWFCTQKLSS